MADVRVVPTLRFGRWLVETSLLGALGGLICWYLDKELLGFFAPGGYGLFVLYPAMIGLGCVAMLGQILFAVQASARSRLGNGLGTSSAAWRAAAVVCVLGWLPWFGPDEVRLGLTPRLAVGPALLAGTVWLTALAVAVPAAASRTVRRAAVAALAMVAVAWLPVHDAVVSSATAAALHEQAIPRSSALTVFWPGYLPDKYLRVSDSTRLQYDLRTTFPCPDCGSTGVLTVIPATSSPCALPMAIADGGTVTAPADCRRVSSGTWSRQTPDNKCDVLEVGKGRTIEVYEDDCPGTPALLHILRSLRPADSAEILSWT